MEPWLFSIAAASLLLAVHALMPTPSDQPGSGSFKTTWLRRAACAWLAAAAISTVLALIQYAGFADAAASWVSSAPAGEAFANLRQRNQFASLTAIGMAAILFLPPRSLSLVGASGLMALLAMGMAATTSRTGLAQLLLLLVLAHRWRSAAAARRATLLCSAVGAYALSSLVLPWLLELWTGVAGPSLWGRVAFSDPCSSRRVLWSNVAHLITLKPWTGWGAGELDFAHYSTLYEGARFCDILDNAHNLPLQLAFAGGIPMALLVCGLFVGWVVKAAPWRERYPSRQFGWAVLALILLHSMVEYPLWYGPFQLASAACVLALWRRPDASPDSTPPAGWLAERRACGSIAAIATAAIAYAAWDYHRISQIYLRPEERAAAYRIDPAGKAGDSWLFASHVQFAELTTTDMARANASWMFDVSQAMLHFSPEPSVIEKVVESAVALGRVDDARLHLARFKAAFPREHARWSAALRARAADQDTPEQSVVAETP